MVKFGMVTTRVSAAYTRLALASFFAHTPLGASDQFYLIDNDGDFEVPAGYDRVIVIRNERPLGFAANVNQIVRVAESDAADVVFLNNDVVLTPGWLAPLIAQDDGIFVPLSNQQIQYSINGRQFPFLLEPMDYFGCEDHLLELIEKRQGQPESIGLQQDLNTSFFCFRLPYRVYRRIGVFDEGFGAGGGEDVDYRIRAHMAGVGTYQVRASFILHFLGKSTWRSGEDQAITRARTAAYLRHFQIKWGQDLAQIFLFGPQQQQAVERLGFTGHVEARDFRGIIETCLARRRAEIAAKVAAMAPNAP